MRVLWLCNVIISGISKELGLTESFGGGWLEETFETLIKDNEFEMAYCAPCERKGITHFLYKGTSFFGFEKSSKPAHKYDKRIEIDLKQIVQMFKPDIVHIFGTEYPHTLAMTRVVDSPKKIVVHIQGLTYIIGECYRSFLPSSVYFRMTLRDFLKWDNIALQKRKFKLRGEFELNTLQKIKNVMGRTEFDSAMVKRINPNINYFHCNENLRHDFIINSKRWCIKKCERHSIFISQSSYPIKGLHIALKAIKEIKVLFPDVKLYVAGEDYYSKRTNVSSRIKQSSYKKYICELITRYDLKENVKFIGIQTPDNMLKHYLNCNVFILPSIIENSPNSLLEAMSIGTPTVASDVGGIPDFISHKNNGFLYSPDEYYMLSYYILKIFQDDELAETISRKAYESVIKQLDLNNNILMLKEIYKKIYSGI